MATAVSEKVKADWKKAQQESGHRVSRLRTIVTQAATEAFSEIKGGSSELEALGRQSLAEMMAQLQTQAEATVTASTESEPIPANTEVSAVVAVSIEDETAPAPTWAELFAQVVTLVKARKTDWGQALLTRLDTQLERFDADMTTEYGARYRLFQPFVWGLRRVVALGLDRLAEPAPATEAPATPVTIEVLDDSDI